MTDELETARTRREALHQEYSAAFHLAEELTEKLAVAARKSGDLERKLSLLKRQTAPQDEQTVDALIADPGAPFDNGFILAPLRIRALERAVSKWGCHQQGD